MWSDKIYTFLDKYRDGVIIVGVPAICVLAFVVLQFVGAGVFGTFVDYGYLIFMFYSCVVAVLMPFLLIAEVADYLEEWRLCAFERRVRRDKVKEASCTRSPDSF